MFIVGAAAGGGVIWRASHGNYSDYSDYYGDHSNHSAHSRYGDSSLVSELDRKKSEIDRKEIEIDNLRDRMEENFNARVNELRKEKNYSGLYSDADSMIEDVKEDMRREIDEEIQNEKKQLEQINNVVAKINEIELHSKKR